jgi:hypothetical protein
VILLAAIAAGLLTGLILAHWLGQPYQPPQLRHLWLVFAAFLPQFIILYLPTDRISFPGWLTVLLLTASQVGLLAFVWMNRHLSGMLVLLCGVTLNLTVMTANGGFMPISPQTASRLVPEESQVGSRFDTKDVLLPAGETRFEWLADRFLPPGWFPYQVAFSLGDVFIALGVFWLLASPGPRAEFILNEVST